MPTVEAFQKQDPGAGTDTAHADNLARHIHQSVLLENVSSVCRQGFSVGRENASQLGKQLLSIRVREELGHTNYQRRVAHNPWLAIHDGRESLEGLRTVFGAGLGQGGVGSLGAGWL